MKKLALGILIAVVVLALSGVALAISNQGAEKSKAPDLEKIEFIHYKKGFAKPETAKVPKAPTCYKFLTSTKVKWATLPVSYVINLTNSQGLEESFVKSAISTSAETWDAATNRELINDTYVLDYAATYGVQDYKNAITFGNYSTANVIAVTTIWYNPVTKAIVEFDIMFDTDWTWGDATKTETPSAMDLQNIATHELGHGIGLADVYETACNAVTMYGYSNYGDTQKRTLETPDVTGLRTLYGI
ncbi:matrixin family metalloprotease [Patescibacteria group bacterium]|nr:matrixin family metalloprotease [Patescibacteria group bacterium]